MRRLTPEELEAKLHAVLRDQPLRRAPHTLENRVLAEIARRDALPWWRKSYAHWPFATQALFLLLGAGIAAAAVLIALRAFGGASVQPAVALLTEPVSEAWATFRAAGGALVDVARNLLPTIPTTWIYALLVAVGVGYATLIGLGATAYRLLWQPR